MCRKCHNRGTRYQIDGSITTIKPCDCRVAKEEQLKFAEWVDKFRAEINEKVNSL